MTPLSLFQRQCGECQACCTAVGVQELGKPNNFRCEHQCDKGCKVYSEHPPSCKEYKCLWLEGELDFTERPDKLGILFHCREESGEFWADGHLLPVAAKNMKRIMDICYGLLKHYAWLRGIRLICPDQVMNVEYPIDLEKYPDGQNDEKSGTRWTTQDDKIYILDAPSRIKV